MSLSGEKAEEILALCLMNESAQMKTKVYEILSLSEIKSNDPMFLVLALTGQMRVFLEAAPRDLGELLEVWKTHTSESMAKLLEVFAQVKASQEEQHETIKHNIEEISSQGVDNIRTINKELIAEILASNTEVEQQVKDLVEELAQVQLKIQADRKTNVQLMQSLIEGITQTYTDLDKINLQIKDSISSLEKVEIRKSNKWVMSAALVISGLSIIIGSSISYAILTAQKPKQSSLINSSYSRLSLPQSIPLYKLL